ncbi:MAG: hypothetical protein AABX83_02160 [Nanoarchaeota archaeon]
MLTSIEIIALIVILIGAIKIIVIALNPKGWLKVAQTIYSKPIITAILSIILGSITLKFLLQELNIVHIFAVMLFFVFIIALGISSQSEFILKLAEKSLSKNVIKKSWLSILVWIILSAWVLYEIFY